MAERVHLSQLEFPEELITRLGGFLKTPDLSGSSSSISEFEQSIAKLSGRQYAAALSSGTAAIHLALQQLDVQRGDDVACQSFTFCATANPIAYAGVNPVFIDSESDTWNMCPDTLREYLTQAKSCNRLPKAIIYVHVYGMPAKIVDILNVAEEFGVPVIEDAAESIGSTVQGKPLGQFGDFSIISFNGNKIATTSGGGVLLSDSFEFIEKAKYLATQARASDQFEHNEVGYNYRMGALNALVGLVQLDHLQEAVAARQKRFNDYKEALKDVEGLDWQPELDGSSSNRWLSTLLLSDETQPQKLISAGAEQNIEFKRLWKPMHLQKSFAGSKFFGSGTCVDLWERGICLPSGKLPDGGFERVVGLMKNVLGT